MSVDVAWDKPAATWNGRFEMPSDRKKAATSAAVAMHDHVAEMNMDVWPVTSAERSGPSLGRAPSVGRMCAVVSAAAEDAGPAGGGRGNCGKVYGPAGGSSRCTKGHAMP